MILKNDDVIIEVKDNKAGSINFNENDPVVWHFKIRKKLKIFDGVRSELFFLSNLILIFVFR